MSIPLFMKLASSGGLSEDDRATLGFRCRRSREVRPRIDLVSEGQQPDCVHVVLEGFACRYKLVQDGARQIVALLVPGDLYDPSNEAVLGPADHAVGTLTPCRIVDIPHGIFGNLTARSPGLKHALHRAGLVEHRVMRTWLTNLGARSAEKHMAHLFCELLMRLQAVGLADEDGYAMPLRQPELGDMLGITSVHVNRALKKLRSSELVDLKKRRLTIPEVGRLKNYCGFDPGYLHLSTGRATANAA